MECPRVGARCNECNLVTVRTVVNAVLRSCAVAMLWLAIGSHAEVYTGKVVAIADGDTLTVLDQNKRQHKVRLAGIDAPEKAQAFGDRSRQSLAQQVHGKTVTVHTHKLDRYGREVGKFVIDERDVNLQQIRRGMAWFYRNYERELSEDDRRLYREAEETARTAGVGLWRDGRAQAPWEFRKIR